jgi:multicomponent Na+:H+ antiporter subunit E
VWLTVVWVLFWGDLSVANVLSGAALASLIVAVFPLPPIVFPGRLRPLGLARLVGRFAADLIRASLQVSRQAVRFGTQPRNAVIEVDLFSRSDLYLTITAELLSLVPGSLVVEARRSTGTLYLHVLGIEDAAEVERFRAAALAQEERVMRALASRAELEAYDLARGGRR